MPRRTSSRDLQSFTLHVGGLQFEDIFLHFSIILADFLYQLLLKLVPPEMKEIPGGQETVARALRELGPMTASEKKLMALSVILLFLGRLRRSLRRC